MSARVWGYQEGVSRRAQPAVSVLLREKKNAIWPQGGEGTLMGQAGPALSPPHTPLYQE